MTVKSRIDGEFRGWEGETLFKLENGQVWQQSKYAYKYKYKFRPKVTITGTITKAVMEVEGMDTTVTVKQLV